MVLFVMKSEPERCGYKYFNTVKPPKATCSIKSLACFDPTCINPMLKTSVCYNSLCHNPIFPGPSVRLYGSDLMLEHKAEDFLMYIQKVPLS